MKKQLYLALVLALLLGVSACGGGGGEASPYETGDVRAMADAGAFSEELEELDGDTAFALYKLADCGLSREALEDCAVLRSAGATCEEGAVLVFDSADSAQTARGALEEYIRGQIEANTDYRPAELPKLENALLELRENTLLLAVASDLDAAKGAVE